MIREAAGAAHQRVTGELSIGLEVLHAMFGCPFVQPESPRDSTKFLESSVEIREIHASVILKAIKIPRHFIQMYERVAMIDGLKRRSC